jgi:hypothetical protein
MLKHGANIVAVTFLGAPGRPAKPTRMATSSGRVRRAASTASPALREDLRLIATTRFVISPDAETVSR